MRKHFSAGAILTNGKNQFYLIHQLVRDEWLLPKGTIEEGETELETAFREVQEESGFKEISIVNENPVGFEKYSFTHPETKEKIDKKVTYFHFKINSDEKSETPEMEKEHLSGRWFCFDEAYEKITFDGPKKILKDFINSSQE
jgi:8-oxo-dGTP pyrophosphatase MutT (NUDIX family)